MDTLKRAEEFAVKAHTDQNQMYDDDKPYDFHLRAVVAMAEKYEIFSPANIHAILAVCWLHDIIEDTPYSYQNLKKEFGIYIADIVYDVSNELGKNRKERALKTYAKIANNRAAVFVKLCDRLANVSYHGNMYEAYKKEYAIFRYFLHQENEYTEMWDELDNLLDWK